LRFSIADSSPKIAGQCLETLAMLLSMTLPWNKDAYDETGDCLIARENEKHVADAASALLRVVNEAEWTATDIGASSTRSTSEDEEFSKQVRSRLSSPILILLTLILDHGSRHVRLAGIDFFCRSILVDTYRFWADEANDVYGATSRNNSLIQNTTECVLAMLGDDDGKSLIHVFF